MDIANRAFLVTGGASGLGEATVKALLAKGAQVVVADVKGEAPEGATFVATDVTDDAQCEAAVAAAAALPGGLAGVVNCAGVGIPAKVLGKHGPHDLDLYKKIININLIGTFSVIRHAAAAMAQSEPGPSGERGVIIMTSSAAGSDGQIGQAAYSASKGGVVAMTLPIARELAAHGIRCMTIAPGIFHTPMMAGISQEAQDALGKMVPFPARLGRPDEYAALAVHIVENQMLNGEVIRLDGAIRMAPK